MRRRDVIVLLGGAGAAWPLRASAASAERVDRIAWVHPSAPVADLRDDSSVRAYKAFLEELRRLGRVEGKNLTIDRYSGAGLPANYAELARDVVQTRPRVIFTSGSDMTRRLAAATGTIPIVAILTDPLATGLLTNLAHPTGNVTGAAVDAGIEIWGKRLGLLKEAVPGRSRVGFLASRSDWERAGRAGAALRDAAPRLGLTLVPCLVEGAADDRAYRQVFAAVAQRRVDALVVSEEAERFTYRKLIVELAQDGRLPGIYPYREYAELGGFMAYAVDLADAFRHGAAEVDRLLRGAEISNIPFYQQTKFELILNLKAAKALGLPVTPMMLARADEVLE